MRNEDIETLIKRSNRDVYNKITPDEYDQNESLFNETRKKEYALILNSLAKISGNENYLDIGTGTGNLLRISQNIFKNVYATDISERMLAKIKDKFPSVKFAASDAEDIPFKNGAFNCVSCNALLHHLYAHEKIFTEIYRVLVKGGTVYTDHDPNYFFNRFYHVFYKIRYRGTHGFGSKKNDIAEYHNVFSPGINPEKLAEFMSKIGFKNIKIKYRLTDKSDWKGFAKFAYFALKLLNKILPFKSLRTHFSITAEK